MKTNLNGVWKYVVGGGTLLAYQGFYDRMTNNKSKQEMLEMLDNLKANTDILIANETKTSTESVRNLKHIEELKDCIKNLSNIENSYRLRHAEVKDPNASEMLFKSYNQEFTEAFNKAKEIANKIENDNITKNSMLPIDDIIESYKNYLSELSLTDICLVINIGSCIFILFSIITIILHIYGNMLIDKLNLELKYPRLANIIKLRTKLKNIYIWIDVVLIILALIGLIIVNILTLVN